MLRGLRVGEIRVIRTICSLLGSLYSLRAVVIHDEGGNFGPAGRFWLSPARSGGSTSVAARHLGRGRRGERRQAGRERSPGDPRIGNAGGFSVRFGDPTR